MSSCTLCKVLMFVLMRGFYVTAGGATASEKPANAPLTCTRSETLTYFL